MMLGGKERREEVERKDRSTRGKGRKRTDKPPGKMMAPNASFLPFFLFLSHLAFTRGAILGVGVNSTGKTGGAVERGR